MRLGIITESVLAGAREALATYRRLHTWGSLRRARVERWGDEARRLMEIDPTLGQREALELAERLNTPLHFTTPHAPLYARNVTFHLDEVEPRILHTNAVPRHVTASTLASGTMTFERVDADRLMGIMLGRPTAQRRTRMWNAVRSRILDPRCPRLERAHLVALLHRCGKSP